jgi:histidyl-tRNA synthetase
MNDNAISGFPELSLQEELIMQKIISEIKKLYGIYGYMPMETRLVELLDLLLNKGIDGKEVFILDTYGNGEIREKTKEEHVYALRFDLTTPFARKVAQQYKTMKFPLKRSQIQKVYRAEVAREGLGRFCEFYQADIDII